MALEVSLSIHLICMSDNSKQSRCFMPNVIRRPSNDPAGGVSLILQTSLYNPSSVGMSLSSIGFRAFFGTSFLGPISSPGVISLVPKSTTGLTLAGRLIQQTTPLGLQDVSTVLNGADESDLAH